MKRERRGITQLLYMRRSLRRRKQTHSPTQKIRLWLKRAVYAKGQEQLTSGEAVQGFSQEVTSWIDLDLCSRL